MKKTNKSLDIFTIIISLFIIAAIGYFAVGVYNLSQKAKKFHSCDAKCIGREYSSTVKSDYDNIIYYNCKLHYVVNSDDYYIEVESSKINFRR